MLNNIKFIGKKVRKFLVYLEVSIRIRYLCTRFQTKSIDYHLFDNILLDSDRPETKLLSLEGRFRIVLTKA